MDLFDVNAFILLQETCLVVDTYPTMTDRESVSEPTMYQKQVSKKKDLRSLIHIFLSKSEHLVSLNVITSAGVILHVSVIDELIFLYFVPQSNADLLIKVLWDPEYKRRLRTFLLYVVPFLAGNIFPRHFFWRP